MSRVVRQAISVVREAQRSELETSCSRSPATDRAATT